MSLWRFLLAIGFLWAVAAPAFTQLAYGAQVQQRDEEVSVTSYPNPVRWANSVVFQVAGICPCSVHILRVEVYDLSGRLVWRGEAARGVLFWDTRDANGVMAANGVYLYKAYIRVSGTWITTTSKPLVILR